MADETKELIKEAIKEWMDEKVLQFGRWSLMTLACSGIFALVYFIMQMGGFHK
ncbi:hypothetical protein [Bradyrhizobium erythrophlei]|uniref:Uncharacterized protein n=1 Tax=Bradyrhizobium erythrophlei TaxID=1437360 RepID=A0A1M5T8Q8_9BRAD|nr:hypothetical protein [Bradyrhizobium erythrophlei]SHH47088.1 hypothetical protein SAMN05444169_7617 [Bradyrhizobium erythrophlei]